MANVHAEGNRAVANTMTALEQSGSCYIAGKYHAGSATFDRAVQLNADAERRTIDWDIRRREIAEERDLDRQREADGADVSDDEGEPAEPTFPPVGDTAWEVEYWRTRAFPVVCGWCKATIATGNPALPVTHGVCDPCSAKLLDGAA